MRVVAAGVGDYSAFTFFGRKRGDFVVGATEFEGSDGLLIFGLEEKAALVRGVIFRTTEFDQMSPGGNALDARTSAEDIIQGDDKKSLAVKILSFSLDFA